MMDCWVVRCTKDYVLDQSSLLLLQCIIVTTAPGHIAKGKSDRVD